MGVPENSIRAILVSGKSLKEKVLVASFWLYLLEICSRGLTVVQTTVMARLLAPEHFGIIGVFFVVSAALESFTKTGFSKALVQRQNIDNHFLDTAWTISVIRGIVLFVVIFLASPLIATSFNTPEALPVIRVLALSLLLNGFQNIGTVYFSRNLEFRKTFIWKINGLLANLLVSIPLAFILRNEWAIVWGFLASRVTGLMFSFILQSHRPRVEFSPQVLKLLFDYSKWLFLSSVVVFFSKQADRIFVARLLGETSLGLYIIAWRFARIPELLTNPLPNALFPAYSRFQDKPRAMKEKYTKALRVIGMVSVPMVAGIIIFAEPFVSIVLGEKWLSAVLPMQNLTIATGIDIITFTSLSLFNAMGKTSFNFKVSSVKVLVLAALIYPLITYYGVVGASLCYIALALAGLVVWKVEIYKLLKFTIRDLGCLIFPILNTGIVVLACLYLDFVNSISHVSSLLAAICLTVLAFLSVGLAIDKIGKFGVYRDLINIGHVVYPKQRTK